MNKIFHRYQKICSSNKIFSNSNDCSRIIKCQQNYKIGTPCGYFSIGSSMFLCFLAQLKTLIQAGSNLKNYTINIYNASGIEMGIVDFAENVNADLIAIKLTVEQVFPILFMEV